MSSPTEELFCNTCQRNQILLNKTLAEYLPDEEDPEYATYEASLPAYTAELEERYPQVCQACLPRVQDQIRAAGYAAKADNLRRMIDKSQKHSRTVHTSRQTLTLVVIALAKWAYIFSITAGLLWHALGLMADLDRTLWTDSDSAWHTCFTQAITTQHVDRSCLVSPPMLTLVQYALAADLLTLWWNPKLRIKTNSLTGRMSGLKSLWLVRGVVFLLRTSSFAWGSVFTLSYSGSTLINTPNFHLFMLLVLVLSSALTSKTVRIVYPPSAPLRPEEEYLPHAPSSPPGSSYRPAHPHTSTFDTMAQGFTSSFQLDSSSALPPSPTLTEVSSISACTDWTTPAHKSTFGDDELDRITDGGMDWTPTQRRFASEQPDIIPLQFSRSSAARMSPTPGRRPTTAGATSGSAPAPAVGQHSLFSRPSANPFHHRVPAAPRAPAVARLDPWKAPVWKPPVKGTVPNFFKQAPPAPSHRYNTRSGRGGGGSSSTAGVQPASRAGSVGVGSVADDASVAGESEVDFDGEEPGHDTGLRGFGVPRNVQRDAELFASPKLKYDYYGTMRDTGLEETFNGLFSQ
jgi:hypothetical protein